MTPEFSRPFRAGQIGPEGRHETLRATPAERASLAARFGIPAVERLEAELTLRPEPGGGFRVTGTLEAEVVQSCVVTLEPVPQHVAETVELRVLPEGAEFSEDPEAPDEIAIEGDSFDLGEALAEQLALGLDPYPRAPGAELPEEARAGAATPFGALAALRRKQ